MLFASHIMFKKGDATIYRSHPLFRKGDATICGSHPLLRKGDATDLHLFYRTTGEMHYFE